MPRSPGKPGTNSYTLFFAWFPGSRGPCCPRRLLAVNGYFLSLFLSFSLSLFLSLSFATHYFSLGVHPHLRTSSSPRGHSKISLPALGCRGATAGTGGDPACQCGGGPLTARAEQDCGVMMYMPRRAGDCGLPFSLMVVALAYDSRARTRFTACCALTRQKRVTLCIGNLWCPRHGIG